MPFLWQEIFHLQARNPSSKLPEGHDFIVKPHLRGPITKPRLFKPSSPISHLCWHCIAWPSLCLVLASPSLCVIYGFQGLYLPLIQKRSCRSTCHVPHNTSLTILLPIHWKLTAENNWGGIISAWNWRISFLQMPAVNKEGMLPLNWEGHSVLQHQGTRDPD